MYTGNSFRSAIPISQADYIRGQLAETLAEFWSAVAMGGPAPDLGQSWVSLRDEAVDAGAYLLRDQIHTFGGMNQALIAEAAADAGGSLMAGMVVTMPDLCRIFGVEDLLKTPVAEQGIGARMALYGAPVERRVAEYWLDAQDQVHFGPIPNDQSDICPHPVRHQVYQTYPAWSLADVYHLLPSRYQEKAAELESLCARSDAPFEPNSPLEEQMTRRVREIAERQNVPIHIGHPFPAYDQEADEVMLPGPQAFKNPIAFYATAIHELAHSTMHVLGRPAPSMVSDPDAYAEEELIAETVAFLMVRELDHELREAGLEQPEVTSMFCDYYTRSVAYGQHFGDQVDFSAAYDRLEAQEPTWISNLMTDVLRCIQALNFRQFESAHRFSRLVANEAWARLEGNARQERRASDGFGLGS